MVIDNTDRSHEADRLATFSGESEKESLDRLSRLAARAVAAPMAFISLKDRGGLVCAGSSGLPEAWASAWSDGLPASLPDLPTPLVLADAREHGLLQEHPVLREIGTVAYVRLPLKAPNDQILGALSVIDTGRRDWTGDDIGILTDLAVTVLRERGPRASVGVPEPDLHATIDSFPLPAVLLDPSGNVRGWNAMAEHILGWRESEVVGQPCPAVPENKRGIYNALFARVLRGEALADMEIHRRKRDGSRLDLSVLLSPVYSAGGRVIGVMTIFADISKLTRVEEEALWSEVRFQALIEHSTDGIALLGQDGIIRYSSPSTSPILGYSPEEFVGRNVFDGVHPDDCDRLKSTFARALAEPGVRFIEQYRYQHKDGSWRCMESVGTNLLTEPGVEGIVANFRDITERKRSEAELRARAHQQAAVARLGQRALADIDLDSLMDEASTLITQTLDVEYVKILELLPDGDAFLLRAGKGWREGLIGQSTVGAGLDSQAGYALSRGEAVVVEDLRTERRFDAPALLRSHDVVSGVTTIIGDAARPFGVLGVHTVKRRTFSRDDNHFLQAIASVLASAIERKQAEAGLVRRGRQLEILCRASQEVNAVLEIPVIMRTLVTSAMELVAATAGTYGRPVEGRMAFTEYHEGDVIRSIDETFEPGVGVPGWVMETRSPYVSSDPATDLHVLPGIRERFLIAGLVNVPILGRTGDLLGCFELHNKLGGRTFNDDDLALLQGLASSAAVAIENAQLYRQAREAEESSRRYAARVVSLATASRIFAEAGHDLSVITETITRLVSDLLGDSCGIHLFSSDGKTMIATALYNPDEAARSAFWKLVGAKPMRTDRGLTSVLLRTGEPLLVPELDLEKLRGIVAPEHFSYLERFGLRSLIVVPLRVQGRIIGMLDLARYRPDCPYTSEDQVFLQELADRAALAIENTRLYQQLAERERRLQDLVGRLLVAQEEERHRVAYEVHDGLAQVAAGAHQHLQAYARYHRPRSPEARSQLERALELAQRTVREARGVVANLRPTTLDDFGLEAAVRLQVEDLEGEGWEVSYREGLGRARLAATVETALYRVAQEALTNVRKHARTERVAIVLEREEGLIRLEVRDWGRGFEPEAVVGKGLGEQVGLVGMEERVALLGGQFRIESRPGAGTRVVAEVPVVWDEQEVGDGE